MNTGHHYYALLTTDEQQRFKANVERQGKDLKEYLDNKYMDFEIFIFQSFAWKDSNEGVEYWYNIALSECTEPPQIKHPTTIKVFPYNQPCLSVSIDHGNEFGLNRDRCPDAGWGQIHHTRMDQAKEVELTPELKQILIEDLAFVYGQDSAKFTEKMKEFNLI